MLGRADELFEQDGSFNRLWIENHRSLWSVFDTQPRFVPGQLCSRDRRCWDLLLIVPTRRA
jgi:hypothetical protein